MFLDILVILLFVIIILAAFMLLRTLSFARPFNPVEPVTLAEVNARRAAEHLSTLIRCPTISEPVDGKMDVQPFIDLHNALEEMYPRVHASLKQYKINDLSLLYVWEGSDADLLPLLLMAHQDVVPVDPATASQWTHPPFSGEIVDGVVWGRGAMDIKNQITAIFESVELLLQQGYKPQRTVYLAFGYDEEVLQGEGQKKIMEWLKERGVKLEAVLDEGAAVINGAIPGVKVPVALIGVSEKGYLTLEVKVQAAGGHSSVPPPQTAIGILARGLARLEVNPMPSHIRLLSPLFTGVGAALPFINQMAFANQWLFGGFIRRLLESTPQTNASIRTTTAITMISGGIKDNVLPAQAKAIVNFRLVPGDTIASVCEHVRWAMADSRITFQPVTGTAWEASPFSPTDSQPYRLLERSIRETFGNLPVAPFLVTGATDARHYTGLTGNVYRFSPVQVTADDLTLAHGTNERLSIENMECMVQFFVQLIHVWAGN